MTARQPLVSIVTPTKNRATMLEATLRSVRGQTYPNVEHIVMDGDSNDGTVDLLRRFEGTYRMRWESKADAGMYPAINEGLLQTTGEIVAYLNSDDLYFPWTIDVVVDAFRRHPNADFVFGDVLAIDDETGDQAMILNPPFHLDFIRRVGFLPQPGVFWRRSMLDLEDPFDETLRYVADCDYWMRVGSRRHFEKVNEFLAVERNHTGTLRQVVGSPLWSELEAVRSRYVAPSGEYHEERIRRYRRRSKMWTRIYSLVLLLQTLMPRRARIGPWAHMLNRMQGRPSRSRLFVRAIPYVGRIPRLRSLSTGEILGRSRQWLEPPP
jgi:glycosyltransferase involved in cell wall biosynthesis